MGSANLLDKIRMVLDSKQKESYVNRAKLILSDLLKNQNRRNAQAEQDLIALIKALSESTDPDLDLEEVVSTAEMLIHEITKTVTAPDKKLLNELLEIVFNSAIHEPLTEKKAVTEKKGVQSSESTEQTEETETSPASEKASTATKEETVAQPKEKQTALPEHESRKGSPNLDLSSSGGTMVKLIMEEVQELIKKHSELESQIRDLQTKFVAFSNNSKDDVEKVNQKQTAQDAKLAEIMKSMDKFISLYEIVINQYNPFVEQIVDDQRGSETKQKSQENESDDTQEPVVAKNAKSSTKKGVILNKKGKTITDLNELIDELKRMDETQFNQIVKQIPFWVTQQLDDEKLAMEIDSLDNQKDVIKSLFKKALKMNLSVE